MLRNDFLADHLVYYPWHVRQAVDVQDIAFSMLDKVDNEIKAL